MMVNFIRYREMLLSLTLPVLDRYLQRLDEEDVNPPVNHGVEDGDEQIASRALDAATAKLMLVDDQRLHGHLVRGLQEFARIGGGGGGKGRVDTSMRLHLHLAAFGRRYESLSVLDWGECEAAIPAALLPARHVEEYSENHPPTDLYDLALWQALCIFEQSLLLHRDVDAEWIDGVVHQVVAHGGEKGSLQPPPPAGESIDRWTNRDLCGLHALANLALLARNDGWSRRVRQVASFHVTHTKPTAADRPWAVFAFVWSDQTRGFAEQLIAAFAKSESSGPPVELLDAMLLADAANSIATFCD